MALPLLAVKQAAFCGKEAVIFLLNSLGLILDA
jgi:hypothetical protein